MCFSEGLALDAVIILSCKHAFCCSCMLQLVQQGVADASKYVQYLFVLSVLTDALSMCCYAVARAMHYVCPEDGCGKKLQTREIRLAFGPDHAAEFAKYVFVCACDTLLPVVPLTRFWLAEWRSSCCKTT